MEHGGDAHAGAEMPEIGGDGSRRLGRGLEQQVVDRRLVLVRDGADRGRQGEDEMIIGYEQKLGLAGGEPVPGRCPLGTWGNADCGMNCRQSPHGRGWHSAPYARRPPLCGRT